MAVDVVENSRELRGLVFVAMVPNDPQANR